MSSAFREVVQITRLGGLLSRPFFQSMAKTHHISLNEWRALVLIVRSPGVAAQDIAEFTGMHAMNVSRAVAGLRRHDRITSAKDPGNHRRQLLEATDAGRALYELLYPSAEGRARDLFSVLAPDEHAAFSSMLDRLVAQAEIVMNEPQGDAGDATGEGDVQVIR